MYFRALALLFLALNVFCHDDEFDYFQRKPKIHEHKQMLKERNLENLNFFGIDKIDRFFNEYKSVSRIYYLFESFEQKFK